jgi:hypothetical protein
VAKTAHTVVQPEHVAAIADGNQLESFAKVWNDPDNAELRKRREVPHALLPGDVVAIPEREPLIYQKPTGKQHVFTVHLMPLKLRLVLLDELGKPFAHTAGTLTVDGGGDQDITTDADGLTEVTINHGTTAASLTLGTRTYRLQIGHLDPIDEVSGQLARLKALGYFDGQVPEAADFENERDDIKLEVQLAWELLQDAHGLKVTGQANDDSVRKLKDAYGA